MKSANNRMQWPSIQSYDKSEISLFAFKSLTRYMLKWISIYLVKVQWKRSYVGSVPKMQASSTKLYETQINKNSGFNLNLNRINFAE